MGIEQKIDELLDRGVAEVIGRDRLKERLFKGEKLRVKLGIDPTSPNIHLGRAVALRKLRDFQDLGCEVHFIIGDFTGTIGDTSDKESERPMLSQETVEENLKTYFDQAYKILDREKTVEHRNSEWLSKLGYAEIGRQADAFSLHEFIARENIKKRLDAGKRISLREVLYPLMQGYDSVMTDADVEIGGTDQRFNILAGRTLQEAYKKPAQDIILVDLIPGTDGRKMSSSWGNTINLLDEPNDMFGKVMSMPDDLIGTYFEHCTRVPMEEIAEIMKAENPRDAKVRLAKEIVALYHGEDEAAKAEEYFVNTFSKREIPEDIGELEALPEETIVDFIVRAGFAESKGDARRKIEQGGVSVDGEKISVENLSLPKDRFDGKVLKVGKKDFIRIVFQ